MGVDNWGKQNISSGCPAYISQHGSATLAAAVHGPELQMNDTVSQIGLIVSSLFFSVVHWRNDAYDRAEVPKE